MDVIRTERLLLRKACEGDLPAIHRILSDDRAMRYWSSLPHADLEQTREWLSGMIAAPAETSFDFIVELDGEAIGKAGCYRLPEIGYILHPEHWGKGYAREALAALIPEIFARYDLPALTADVDPDNLPSIRLVEGLGFTFTHRAARTWLLGDVWHDSVYYALKRP